MRFAPVAAPIVALVLLCGASAAAAQTATTVSAAADNTLIEDFAGSRSNGAGDAFYTGRTQRDGLRRGLVRFDLSAIPPGAVVQSATVSLRLAATRPATSTITLNRALQSWGEGASAANLPGGVGAPAAAGDATWLVRFFGAVPAQPWTSPGGDFTATASATATVAPVAGQVFTWSGPGLVADVQEMVNNPASNRGWFVIDEPSNDAKAFYSREHPTASWRPSLSVTWAPPPVQEAGDVPLPPWALALAALAVVGGLMRGARGERGGPK